ncbi:MAG: hypothetical protein GF398_15275 [Chitinivibrionales bacterium]|nr:hypothetical protein [Chitinivibrionales bacterium]
MAKKIKKREEMYFGIHFDLHPKSRDTELGLDVAESMIEKLIKKTRPDYVQYDCKGHEGLTGYTSKVGWTSPGVKKDSLKMYRKVTKKHGVGLFVHYSGVFDAEAVKHHPEWARLDENGNDDGGHTSTFRGYVDQFMIPQLVEVAEKYDLDGAWIDGECWAVWPDWCPEAVDAWKNETGGKPAPTSQDEELWPQWMEFHRRQFRKYLAHYVDEMHARVPGFALTSAWAHSQFMPEPLSANLDFLSGDAAEPSRFPARILASYGKPWDLMAWGFHNEHFKYHTAHKSPEQLKLEAAFIISQGGGYEIYYQPTRRGRVSDWMIESIAEVSAFCRKRKAVSFQTETVPQIAVLLPSKAHKERAERIYTPRKHELTGARGMTEALLDLGYSVDVVAEFHLIGPTAYKLNDYQLLIIPECHTLDKEFVSAVKVYLKNGGKVLITGAETARLFKNQLGVTLKGKAKEELPFIDTGFIPAKLEGLWQSIGAGDAEIIGYRASNQDVRKNQQPAASFRKVGDGAIAGVYGPLGDYYLKKHSPHLRAFIGSIVKKLYPKPKIRMSAPPAVDMALRTKNGKLLIHLINTSTLYYSTAKPVYDFIPPVGPIELTLKQDSPPRSVEIAGESRFVETSFKKGKLRIKIDRIDLHAVVVVC